MPCFILVIVENLSDQHCFLVSLDVLDIVNRMEITIFCELNPIILQNIACVLESSNLTFDSSHFCIVLLHKFDLMLIRELFFQVFHNFIDSTPEGFNMRNECLVIR